LWYELAVAKPLVVGRDEVVETLMFRRDQVVARFGDQAIPVVKLRAQDSDDSAVRV
jgi:hypothetical protein